MPFSELSSTQSNLLARFGLSDLLVLLHGQDVPLGLKVLVGRSWPRVTGITSPKPERPTILCSHGETEIARQSLKGTRSDEARRLIPCLKPIPPSVPCVQGPRSLCILSRLYAGVASFSLCLSYALSANEPKRVCLIKVHK